MKKLNDIFDTSDTKSRPHRGIYLLPNLFTTAAMFAGFYAIVAAMNDAFEPAAIAVVVAWVLDTVDGRVARMTNTQTVFGAEYDSLSDLVSFGLAPALVMYEWALVEMQTMGWLWAKLGWLAAFFYTAAAALRLAKFNTIAKGGTADKRYFRGLPSPAAAGLLITTVWMWHDMQFSGADLRIPAFLITIIAGALMVTNFSYYSFKDINFKNKVPFAALLAVVLVIMFITIDPPKVLFAAAIIYALSAPIVYAFRKYKRRSQRTFDT